MGGGRINVISSVYKNIKIQKITNTQIQKHPTYRYEERQGAIWKEGGSMLSPRPSFFSALRCSHGK